MTASKTNGRQSVDPTAPTMKKQGRIAIVRLDGHVERAGIEACDYMLSSAGDSIGGAILDLSLAHHIDYRATVILVARRRVLRSRGRELAVVAARSDVRLIIRASAGSEIPVFPTREEAMAYVQGEPGPVVTAGTKSRSKSRISKVPPARP
jgi:anti-anti-sigma regulatory factor